MNSNHTPCIEKGIRQTLGDTSRVLDAEYPGLIANVASYIRFHPTNYNNECTDPICEFEIDEDKIRAWVALYFVDAIKHVDGCIALRPEEDD